MSNFWQRTLTGVVFVLVLVGAVLWNRYSFAALCFVVCVLGLREYALLFRDRLHKPNFWGTVIGGSGIALIWALASLDIRLPISFSEINYAFTFFLLFPFVMEAFVPRKLSLANIGLSYGGIVYINLGLACFLALQSFIARESCLDPPSYNGLIPLGFLILQWSSDTFAYLTGRAFGKTPLAPKISPKKTIEGSIGGAICTIGISFLLYKFIGVLSMAEWAGLALVIVVFGTLGDLAESKLKRTLGIKDSGNILPGHGGILDRFDSLLLAAPAAFIFLGICMY